MRLDQFSNMSTVKNFQNLPCTYAMAEGLAHPLEIFKAIQDEGLKLFELALQAAYIKLDQIANEAKLKMENILRDLEGARKVIEKQLLTIQEHTLELIRNLVKETEKYILNIWEKVLLNIVTLADNAVSLMDTQRINNTVEQITNFMSNKITEFNQRLKVHADAVIELQEQFFLGLMERLGTLPK